MTAEQLPWTCPDHPEAQIRHSWDQNHYVLNGYPAGTGWKSGHRYECAVCGRELSAEGFAPPVAAAVFTPAQEQSNG